MMQPLQGSFVALVTPMSPGGGIDFHALEALIEWHVESGTNGIVLLEQRENLQQLVFRAY